MKHPIIYLLLFIILALSGVSCSTQTKTRISQQTEPTQLAQRPTPAPATTTTLGTNSPDQATLLKAWSIGGSATACLAAGAGNDGLTGGGNGGGGHAAVDRWVALKNSGKIDQSPTPIGEPRETVIERVIT